MLKKIISFIVSYQYLHQRPQENGLSCIISDGSLCYFKQRVRKSLNEIEFSKNNGRGFLLSKSISELAKEAQEMQKNRLLESMKNEEKEDIDIDNLNNMNKLNNMIDEKTLWVEKYAPKNFMQVSLN